MVRELWAGVTALGRGFGSWRTRPRLMALGLIPAGIAFVILAASLITFAAFLPTIVEWATPFAASWNEAVQVIVRIALGLVAFGAASVLAVLTFTALTLAIGDPFYERISRGVEEDLGGEIPDAEGGFWRGIVDGLQLVALGVLAAVLMFLLGLIPIVGSIAAAVLGFIITARLLARELTSRTFETHGVPLGVRRKLLKRFRWRVLGFGIVTQLCFLIPLGAVAAMPAAVAGATMLGRDMLAAASQPPQAPPESAPSS
ncbi:EI24 domain-containing protein [Microbacterium sp. MPKO10]|uniref:EI24 domain-containing protein n=1 Tax=Microbacterium sp. MPKO10 TaxID=2989818 RepID=UPI0022356BB2|nr:EI24 domain-containing protein [Microbacterium sp. MPKO10]MCW4457495.1 EI24 domain-containing protein [Microbacterium sp. MPKO10]